MENSNLFNSRNASLTKSLFNNGLICKIAKFNFLFVVAFSLFYVGCQESTTMPEGVIEPQPESEILAMPASQGYIDTLSFGENGFDLYITDTLSVQDTFQFSGIDSSGNNFQMKIVDVPNTDSMSFILTGQGPHDGDTYEIHATAEFNSTNNGVLIQSIYISQNGGPMTAAADPYWECVNETHDGIMTWIDDHAMADVGCAIISLGSDVTCSMVALGYALVACLF
jgi:hypothetical protein